MTINFISPNDTKGLSDSISIQNAVNKAHESGINKVVIPRINERTNEPIWIIDTTIRLPSDMCIILDNCFMQMDDGVVGGFFCSDNLFTERGTKLEHRMKNITIKGEGHAVLDGGKATELNEGTQTKLGVPVRLNSPIFFMNVEGFSVQNISITNQRYWGMRFQFCARGIIRDIFFSVTRDRRNQDGINLRNGCHDILIENIFGQSGDDMIALSAIDTDKKVGFNVDYPLIVEGHDWDIHDVVIRNISGAAIRHPLVALRNHNGAKIYNITIEHIRDTDTIVPPVNDHFLRYALIAIGNNSYAGIRHSEIGETYGITIRDVHASYSTRIIYTQATLKNCHFSDLHASGLCRYVIATTPDGWANAKSGVKIENVTMDGVYFKSESGKESAVSDFRIMREDDYVKNLYINNLNLENVDHLAILDDKYNDIDIEYGRIHSDNPKIGIRYSEHYDELPTEAESALWVVGDRIIEDCRK